MKCGLLGRKLGHSYSPQIHKHLGSYSYHLFEKEPEELQFFLRYGEFTGLNVTMPYKKDVIPFLDALSPVARELGAVNTIVRREDGKLIGHNTDHFGFQTMVRRSGLDVSGKKCLVLGSGGASNTASHVLRNLGADVIIISRSGPDHYGNLCRHQDAALIVNATPVGMYPNTGASPIDLSIFPNLEGVLDVVYNPARTQLLLDAEERNLVTINGLLMLIAQAKEASEWFTGQSISDDRIDDIHKLLLQQMENIVLIGMPGCGKSTIGKLLADRLQKKFVDVDQYIEAAAKISIPEIFAQYGEGYFRDLETQALASLGKQSGLVVATGGGCVTQPRNYPLLHQNGSIIWLTRSLSRLSTQGRPLSQAKSPEVLYAQRESLYRQFADHIVDNDRSTRETVNHLVKIWEEM